MPHPQLPHQWPPVNTMKAPPVAPKVMVPAVPKVFLSNAPPSQVSIVLKADNGIRENGSLVLDKRTVCLQVTVLDAEGKRTRTALGLQVVLVYEDLSEMAPGVAAGPLLTGKTDVTCKDGGANLRLRITTVSSAHNKRRFRFKVAPMDVTLAAERPKLIQLSEAFSVVSHTAQLTKPPAPPKTAGPKTSMPPSLAAAAGLSGAVGLNGAPPLTRHRYFSAAELRGATGVMGEGDGPPLTRKALGLSDRLAALVAQQVTQRAWQQARKRPLQEGEERSLRARDVVSAVRKPGQLDFLFHACALRRWAAPDEAAEVKAEAAAGEAEAALLWGPEPDWAKLVAAQPSETKPEARPPPALLQVPQSPVQPQPQPQLQQQPTPPPPQPQPSPPQPSQAGPPPEEEQEAAPSAKRPRTDEADSAPSDAGGGVAATHQQQGHTGAEAASAVVQPAPPSPAAALPPDQAIPADGVP